MSKKPNKHDTPLANADAEELLSRFSQDLRALARGGKIPEEWKARLARLLENRRGANPSLTAIQTAREERDRAAAAGRGELVETQAQLAKRLKITPATLRENRARHQALLEREEVQEMVEELLKRRRADDLKGKS